MAGRHQNRSFPLPGVHSSGQVHAFGNCTDNDMLEEDAEVYELRSRGKEKIRRSTSKDRLDDIIVLTKDIQEGDTLNAIALQYCCTVADIKRVNNLISDQDFFALRSIKIPVKKFSSLTETLYPPKGRQTSRPSSVQYLSEQQEVLSANDFLSSSESAGSFLKEVDRDIEQIVKCTDTKRENLNEVVSALTAQQVRFEPDNKNIQRKDPYYGADWGIGWWTAVVIMLIVGIITPVFYLLYYEILAKVDVSHHSTVDSSHLHSGVTPPSQQREMENEMAPTKGIPFVPQDDHKLYSQYSQLPAARHKT
ncbi:lysM and putative peptidoglycan-binding domain-containing protein 3 [Orcinus orca]|uniref:LysM and putative peptidoglycan-binding domain-containing protein 3 n=1 Tax=Tursiops truncatus TaxID=9739 RepID=A0A2U4AWU4_TURTR|nr:lysM and putative peptidoglycan-binding domain-containing protein 3 [Orcinus orca]XP_004328880.1 lysM and putative peptidoglycan-binding domain-containing protein 3 [Tursiops truncatus]XP_019785269.1 lysM and putative peptidoglycan-binding domain-containing protein 3 [Tursiops truncatus]XP_026956435.1 lysM and putative peptidoglycan-binding domain-containing protein 3 [Lagenorhynchus obliquidens]XP_026956436.1 lysM and putative peptidoglycan-binding domain-containing protein 3 [Lagenorhynchu